MATTIVFVILAVAILLFMTELLPIDLIALLILASTVLTGVITWGEGLAGFANPAVATIAAMFVLSQGLMKTGAVGAVGDRLIHLAGGSEWRVLLMTMLVVSVSSAFVNNTPIVVLFLPIMLKASNEMGIPPSKLLIPLSYAAIMGGTCTLIGTSTNILVSDLAREHGYASFGMFEFTKLGLVLLVVGFLYLMLVGRFLLPVRSTVGSLLQQGTPRREYLTEVVVRQESPYVGKRLCETVLWQDTRVAIIQVIREGIVHQPAPDLPLQAQDLMLIQGEAGAIYRVHSRGFVRIVPQLRRRRQREPHYGRFEESGRLVLAEIEDQLVEQPVPADPKDPPVETPEDLLQVLEEDPDQGDIVLDRTDVTLAEVVLPPNSRLMGVELGELNLHKQYGVSIFAHMRREHHYREGLAEIVLRAGDILLVQGSFKAIERLRHSDDLLVIEGVDRIVVRKKKAPIAIAAVLAVVVLAALDIWPIGVLALSGALLLVLTRCISLQEAYQAIDWHLLILIGGTLALGRAMESSGAAGLMAERALAGLGPYGAIAILSGFYLMTNLMTEIMTNTAAAILMTPIAFSVSVELGADPKPFLFAIMFAASASFSTPIGYQTNTFIYGPGGYRFLDFARVGLPMNIMFWLLATFLIPVFWPLYPV